MTIGPFKFRAIILDVDGVVWISGGLGIGAVELLTMFNKHRFPYCLLTNDCSVSKVTRYNRLVAAGLPINLEQLITAPEVTNIWLKSVDIRRIMYLGTPSACDDVASDLVVTEAGPVDAVIVGDLFDNYDRKSIDLATNAIIEGAQLVAMQRNQRWSNGNEKFVDNGFWVAGFEFVTSKLAIVTGKPSQISYDIAVRRLGLPAFIPNEVAIVSDDAEFDLRGGKNCGLTTIYLGASQRLPEWVDHHVGSIHALNSLLCRGNL